MDGALLVNKHAGVSSFGVIEQLQGQLRNQPVTGAEAEFAAQRPRRRKDLPKLGHGGTLDPFATGMLVVCVGRAVKLARYFLGSTKTYEGVMRFGETTIPGDPTAPISETSQILPESREQIQELADRLARQPYLQTPPMHSAKKKDGRPLYELAREGIEVEREPKLCHLYRFEILSYESPRARFRISCSSGTYIRALAQDFARMMGSVAMLESLHRTGSGRFTAQSGMMTVEEIGRATQDGRKWDELEAWVPFDRLLEGYPRALATQDEARDLVQGRQNVLFNILKRAESPNLEGRAESAHLAIYCQDALIAVACREEQAWRLERVFAPKASS